jgi:hypothetical protein
MDQTGKLVSSSLPAPASQSDSSIEPPARPAFQPDSSSSTEPPARPAFQPDSIAEEDEEDEKEKTDVVVTTTNPPAGTGSSSSSGPCRWAVDLAGTEPYWRGWFEHLSAAFLDVATAKLLLLAGVDRLDRDLTVGQMQVFFPRNISCYMKMLSFIIYLLCVLFLHHIYGIVIVCVANYGASDALNLCITCGKIRQPLVA